MEKYNYKCSKNVFKTLPLKPQEQKGCKLFPTMFKMDFFLFFIFFWYSECSSFIYVNPNNPSVLETRYSGVGGGGDFN